MDILVPLNNIEHLELFLEAGATEFYIGFYDEAWDEKYGKYHDINRLSGFGKMANRYCFQELLEQLRLLVKKEIRSRVSIYVTFNASSYSEEQLKDIRGYFYQLKETKIEGVIVSNLELTMLAHELGILAVISTIAGVYNAQTVQIYQSYGAKRVILPRDLSTEEIISIMGKVPEMEYEIFLMRNGCTFSDSNCLGYHRKELCSVCSSLAGADCVICHDDEPQMSKVSRDNHELYSHSFHDTTCGLCSIYRFLVAGVAACKIVGRSEDYEAICKDIRLVSQNIAIAKKCSSEEEYLKQMVFPEHKESICQNGLSCYYPEIRF